jgi:hypothetical protein
MTSILKLMAPYLAMAMAIGILVLTVLRQQ